jgi:ribosomal protein S18 acetylase RimI-like enzyme
MIRLLQPRDAADWRHARELVEEYAASLNVDLSFQDFAHELEHLEEEYGPPSGAFLLATYEAAFLGCVGLRRLDERTGEMKRLYVGPAGRGLSIGRLLAESLIEVARNIGYSRIVLDTLPSMIEARSLYRSLGFTETTPYRFNPVAGTSFLELRLR